MAGRLARSSPFARRLWSILSRPGRLVVPHYRVEVSTDRGEGGKLRIAFASDFHAGLQLHPDGFRSVCQAIDAAQPDVLLLGGDYVSSDLTGLSELADDLAGLQAPLSRFAVLGDHDTRVNAREIKRVLTSAGYRVLVNETVRLPAPFDQFQIAGLDDVRFGRPDVAALFDESPGIRLLLAHSPAALPLLRERPFRVLFCGHTHGGQIALPGGTPIYLPHGQFRRKFAFGRFEIGTDDSPKTLIVSRGVGCSIVPVRMFAPPDVVVCDFVRCPAQYKDF